MLKAIDGWKIIRYFASQFGKERRGFCSSLSPAVECQGINRERAPRVWRPLFIVNQNHKHYVTNYGKS